ncbi:MAG: ABC transporter ATP-binding protein [candidate division NC10 bacterium]|nr:ABC transporter ATP-binding protein [candidate division NC10 bacterium]
MWVVEAEGLAKTFVTGWLRPRRREALTGVSLRVAPGTIYGIVGPNGAGKTTLLSILATILTPDTGRATLLGHDLGREPAAIRQRLNLVSGHANFVWSLRVAEILDFYARLYGLPARERTHRVEELLDWCELRPYRAVPYNELSTGLKQRLALAKGLVNRPALLLLDEPTVGLDPDMALKVRAQIAALRAQERVTILLCTHYMREAEQLCDRVAFLKRGAILAEGSPAELKRRLGLGDAIRFRTTGPLPDLAGLPGLLQWAVRDGELACTVDEAATRLPSLLGLLETRGVRVQELRVTEPDLEDVFVEYAKPHH